MIQAAFGKFDDAQLLTGQHRGRPNPNRQIETKPPGKEVLNGQADRFGS